jgi:protoheme IX farnesyltransferase
MNRPYGSSCSTENADMTTVQRPSRRLTAFIALTKPGLVMMLVMTTCIGFYLGTPEDIHLLLLLHTLIGTSLSAGGTLALNQFLERDRDALMRRTQKRPLPAGRLTPEQALRFGVGVTVGGLAYLALLVNLLSGLVTAVITVTYLFLYTPLKHRTTLSTVAGAIPGALPPVTGWVAARGEIGLEAVVLFAIMFLWQLPHALALAWLFRDDYARAGFYLLPIVDPDGRATSLQIFINCLALTAVSLVPSVIGLTGALYFYVALAAGLILLGFALHLTLTRSLASARNLFFASLVYLLAQFMTMAIDKV